MPAWLHPQPPPPALGLPVSRPPARAAAGSPLPDPSPRGSRAWSMRAGPQGPSLFLPPGAWQLTPLLGRADGARGCPRLPRHYRMTAEAAARQTPGTSRQGGKEPELAMGVHACSAHACMSTRVMGTCVPSPCWQAAGVWGLGCCPVPRRTELGGRGPPCASRPWQAPDGPLAAAHVCRGGPGACVHRGRSPVAGVVAAASSPLSGGPVQLPGARGLSQAPCPPGRLEGRARAGEIGQTLLGSEAPLLPPACRYHPAARPASGFRLALGRGRAAGAPAPRLCLVPTGCGDPLSGGHIPPSSATCLAPRALISAARAAPASPTRLAPADNSPLPQGLPAALGPAAGLGRGCAGVWSLGPLPQFPCRQPRMRLRSPSPVAGVSRAEWRTCCCVHAWRGRAPGT